MSGGGHDVASVASLTGLSTAEATKLLQKYGGDISNAINGYYTQKEREELLNTDSGKVKWVSRDPKKMRDVEYPACIQVELEKKYRSGDPTKVPYHVGTMVFHISAVEGRQYNSVGKFRPISRIIVPPTTTGPQGIVIDYSGCLQLAAEIDKQINALEAGTSPTISITNPRQLTSSHCAFDQIVHEYISRNHNTLSKDSPDLLHHRRGQPVPHYYANVKGESVERRKLLSLLGLRNLLDAGVVIYGEMRTQLFSSNVGDYTSSSGVHKMKNLTGNAVDLDTTVLRCSDGSVLKTINALARKEGRTPYRNAEEFGNSKEAAEMAKAAAIPLVEGFCKDFKLSNDIIRKRCLEITSGPIPVNTSSRDRGKSAIWQYIGPGVNSFHVNVPNMDDVIGALLRSPWHVIKCWSKIQLFPDKREREEWIEKFFTECIEDSCFNAKWKSVRMFCDKLAHVGTIRDVLQKLEKEHQEVLNKILSSNESDEVIDANYGAILFSVVTSDQLKGTDKNGDLVDITREMIDAYIDDPAVEL